MKAFIENHTEGRVFCPICTHTVAANLDLTAKTTRVSPGQRCPRCHATLDVAVIVRIPEAA
jgi:uncharacterized Zn finger protein (UPF0148 family)